MTRKTLLWACLALLPLGACTSDDSASGTELTFRTGDFEVPVGDSFTCFYTDQYSDRELNVSGASGGQGIGGHHIIAYYADEPRPVGHHPCTDEEMTNLHQIAGSAGDAGAGVLSLRDNLALKVPKGKQFVIQSHYINVSDDPVKVNDFVSLNLMKAEDVFAFVNYFVTNDDGFEIPASTAYAHTTYCTVNRDLDIVLTLGHMHEDGRQYTLEVAQGDNAGMKLRDDTWAPAYTSHPPVTYYSVNEPLHIAAGTRLRQTCDWDNATTHTIVFPREMCLSFMYYFPGDGNDIVCNMTAE